ncbi:hypothetical protein RS130_16860 [Paraglaciecola aquimarina]|uniref:Uncharacterized protein n=1 Tax=Paraglaciecola aquimarina TaxID=1235557 RepID=A0ABU3SZC4_9ALTE|nr:hypothetical protein [Paraglaciecola aquimarina]MDU0355353.1 hypothetical protein [Paraglaciecola aquimarina]
MPKWSFSFSNGECGAETAGALLSAEFIFAYTVLIELKIASVPR